MGFDAGVFFRSYFSRSELGGKARLNLAERDPFSFALFTMIGGGGNFFDDSGRNNFTWNIGALGSLTAFELLTVTGRAYFDIWSDRHCPGTSDVGAQPIDVCVDPSDAQLARLDELGLAPSELVDREGGVRLMTSVIVEFAFQQRWNAWLLFEGAPFQGERPAYTDLFSGSLLKDDIGTYLRLGVTYKF
jgi:hypothetical protein